MHNAPEMDMYEEDTRWIRDYAHLLESMWDRSYSLILFRGLNAFNNGCDDEQIRAEMQDYCKNFQPPKTSHVQGGGTG
jgi:hypothetical protein